MRERRHSSVVSGRGRLSETVGTNEKREPRIVRDIEQQCGRPHGPAGEESGEERSVELRWAAQWCAVELLVAKVVLAVGHVDALSASRGANMGAVGWPGISGFLIGVASKVVGWIAWLSGEEERLTVKYYGRPITDEERKKWKVD